MGCIDTITYDKFPKQKDENYTYPVGCRVKVCYHYDTSKYHYGTIVRDDLEEPFETIIKLDNGRYLRGTECQFSYVDEEVSDRPDYNSDRDYTGSGSGYRGSAELFARARAALGQSEELKQERRSDIYERARAALNGAYTEAGSPKQRIEPDESTLAAKRARAERSERDNLRIERERLRTERSQEYNGFSRR